MTQSRSRPILSLTVAFAALAGAGALVVTRDSDRVEAATARAPVLVELFQSQGCSSCPPANAAVNAIVDRPDVVALSFAVTYWDRLGWKDTFAKPQFTARQWEYAHANGRPQVATPQVWVNGATTIVGSNPRQLAQTIGAARSTGPALSVDARQVTVGAGRAPSMGADVWLAQYDPRALSVPIRAGENGGRTLPHRNIVRRLVNLGRWTGEARSFAAPAADAPLRNAAFVQTSRGGPVLSAAK